MNKSIVTISYKHNGFDDIITVKQSFYSIFFTVDLQGHTPVKLVAEEGPMLDLKSVQI